jgi:hypothetical protein
MSVSVQMVEASQQTTQPLKKKKKKKKEKERKTAHDILAILTEPRSALESDVHASVVLRSGDVDQGSRCEGLGMRTKVTSRSPFYFAFPHILDGLPHQRHQPAASL